MCYRQSLKRRSSRWDQEVPQKCQRIDDSVEFIHSQGDPDQKNTEDSLLSEVQHSVVPLNSHFKDSATVEAERSISDQLLTDEQDKIKAKISCEKETDCKQAVKASQQHSVKIDETDVESVSQENTVADIKGRHFDEEGFSCLSKVEQDPNRSVTEIVKEDEKGRSLPGERKIFCGKARYSPQSSSSEHNSRKAIQWLTHDQKVALVRTTFLQLKVNFSVFSLSVLFSLIRETSEILAIKFHTDDIDTENDLINAWGVNYILRVPGEALNRYEAFIREMRLFHFSYTNVNKTDKTQSCLRSKR